MADYKIELGVQLNKADLGKIKTDLNNLGQQKKINLEINKKSINHEIRSIKKQIESLSNIKIDIGGSKNNSLNLNTTSLEQSLKDVATIIKDIRASIGTIDNKSDMKSLLTSINQITASLGKASDETQTLVNSLNALSKKDFSFNVGINLGNNNKSTLAYGREARKLVLPELQAQIKDLNDLFNQELQTATKSKKINIDKSQIGLLSKVNKIKLDYAANGGNSSSMIGSLEAQEKYINQMVELAKASNIKLDGFYSQHSKSASQLVDELTGVKEATEVVEEQTQRLKNIFGSGIDSESLTQILKDLNEINTAIKTLASDTSLGGLTQSFDNLSNTLKEITRDISTFAQAINSGLVGANNIGSSITNEVKSELSSLDSVGEQAGKKIGDSIEDGVKQNLNLDDVIAKEVKDLMKAEGISARGKAGKRAEEEISTAFRGYLNDGSDAGIRKVTDALLNNKRVVDDTKKSYQELDKYVRSINDGNVKVLLDRDIVNEYGDDFKEMQKLFGKGFVTRVGKNDTFMSFDEWYSGLPKTVINTLNDDYNRINAFGEMFEQLQKQRSKVYMSTQELVSSGNFNFDEAENAIRSAVGNVQSYEQQIKQASDSAADAVVQSQRRQQEAYEATAETVMYHAGVISKLNKAETNGRFYGSNRGTGYFGTGHYFVDSATKHELDNSDYSKLPYTSIDISKYDNLFDATSNEVAGKLHEFLKNLTRFTQGSDSYDMTELFAQFKSVFGDTIMDVQEFGNRIDQLKAFMAKSSFDDRSDSVSTQFMKSLGYEGVDTRGTDYADTRYGTVIYDLKEESVLQANITDELQKQGQMLEKINYEKGQVFDKDTDARIQASLDEQRKRKEISDEFNKSFDSTNFDKAESELRNAQERLSEIDESIGRCEAGLSEASKEANKFAREMAELGFEVSDDEIKEYGKNFVDSYQRTIDELTKEKADLQANIPSLEDAYKKEAQLANEAYKQAEQVIEQRYKEAQAVQEVADVTTRVGSANGLDNIENDVTQLVATADNAEDAISQIGAELSKLGVKDVGLESITKDITELGIEVQNVKTKINGNNLELTIKGVQQTEDGIRRVVTEVKKYEDAVENTENINRTISQSFETSADVAKRVQKEINQEVSEFVKLQSQIGDLGAKVTKLGFEDVNTNQITELKRQLEDLENTYAELMHKFMKKLTINADVVGVSDVSNKIEAEIEKTESKINELKAAFSDAQNKLAKKIVVDIEVGKFDDDISRIDDKFNRLSGASVELRSSIDAVKNALREMENAATPDEDGVINSERLIRAQTEYAAAIEKTNNLLRIQAREEKAAADAQKLRDNRELFQSKIDTWLTNNSKAAKQFGAAMLELKAKAESCDQVELNHLISRFNKLDKAAERANVKGLSFFDQIKAKFKEYSVYFSAAEMFMYAEQGLRSMFEQVKLIDSAMTELKKVTDETGASYNQFLKNAASRAKEIGTTIDGLVKSTASFARLGYGFDDAQGLAEVANIYAVVGDEVEGVEGATESLISTMAAFKDEMNGMSNTDFSMSIIDKMNEVGNNFSISSGGIGEALQRSASSMAAANNSLDETIALITAANTVVQNPEKIGRLLPI